MLQWIKLAYRNILRNKRRSVVTMIAIAVGFTSISIYHGYINNAYEGLRWLAICGERLGHLRINKAGWEEQGKLEPHNYMFSKEQTDKIIQLVKEEKDVVLVTPQIQVMGTVTNGLTSIIFIAQGVIPKDEEFITQFWFDVVGYVDEGYDAVIGEKLNESKTYGVLMAKDMASYLKMKPGSDGIVMAQTLSGQMNAMDMQISGVYDTGNDFSNDKFMRFNFNFAQALLDTQSAERVVVMLKHWKDTEQMHDVIAKKLKNAGIDAEIRTWQDLSIAYNKMKSYLDTIFIFLFFIVVTIVLVTIINTMSNTIVERTKEIGTLRALGMKRVGVAKLFALEGALLGVFGSMAGVVLHTIEWSLIRLFPLHYTPPGLSTPVAMRVNMAPWALMLLIVCFIIISTIAAVIPAKSAAKANIVDSLGHP
ncbi:MAG TPA: FtsX-like permease family protein [Smithella sp.]|jgi:putative ABC transport system permease protein|nr:ABC transporter permease [Smithella sp.]HNQ66181.1 FtsX-like permease family protein [Smithella sp.]HOG10348.1 FtsX-like permease family protein [Smithella sp.]HOO35614.1 FtsX-like permease family protein [Smithella sp.]HOS14584.1 FtsX-like permease family protein [Smithella sp.]